MKYFSLFQVKRVVKFALNETNNFTEITMKKCIMDVKLIKKPRRGCSNDKKTINCKHFHNRRKFVMIVNVFNLSVVFSHKTSSIMFNRSVIMTLILYTHFYPSINFCFDVEK